MYQFVTNNDAGCEDFRRFLRWFRGREAQGSDPSPTFKLGQGGKKVSAETMLRRVADQLDPIRVDDSKVHRFLGSLEIVLRRRSDLLLTINGYLKKLVEKPEDLRHKRKQLIGELVDLGSSGAKTTTSQLLEAAELDPRRLMLASLLPKHLKKRLLASFKALSYEPERDVRGPLATPVRPITVLRGESGLGKSWRLCATAQAMTEKGRLVVLVRASTDLEALRAKIASTVWNPIYSNVAPLSSIAERLRPMFADSRGVWLTVFLDDLNDPELARLIVEDDWASLGIDIVTSCQPPTADWLRRSSAAPELVEVPGFNVEELIRYLEVHGVQYAEVADDVFDLLFKPVLARLFCLLPHGISLRAETEYELMNSFWVYAANERATHVRHPFDLDRLQLVVGDMLSASAAYPWPPSSFVRTLEDAAVFRLMETGIVELDGDRRLSMTHDRLLNWAMAAHLASQAVDRNLDAPQLLALVQRVESLETIAGVNIGRRLGYVLMDLLWLMLGPGRRTAAQVADFLLSYMRQPDFDAYNHAFFRHSLASLGMRAVPLLQATAEAGFSGDREEHWPVWIAEAMRKVADVAWEEVRAAAVTLLSSGDSARIEIALRVIAKVGASDLVDDLFELNMHRTAVREASTGDERVGAIQSKERAFNAFARSVDGDPGWLDRKMAAVTCSAEAEQLLWALVQLDRSAGLPIWRARRDHLFATIPPGKRILPRAIRTFVDPDDLPRLQLPSPDGAEMLHGAVTFDAIARLDPTRAVDILRSEQESDPILDLWGTEGWWMPGLYHRTGAALGAALRERGRRTDRVAPGAALARYYGGEPELLDTDSVDMILDQLEMDLSKDGVTGEERLRQSYWLLSLISSLRTVPTLNRVAARRGKRLERLLTDLVIDRPPSSSRIADREGEMIARILATMAGDGYDRLVLAQIGSTGRTTAEYGFGNALWTSSESVGERLEELAIGRSDDDTDRPYHLMQALAAHGRDAGLARLIEDRSPVYTHATSIRQARRGDTAALVQQIRAKIASPNIDERVQAVDLSHFIDGDESIELTRPLIASAAPGDAVANRLLNQHFHRGRYEPALLPKISPFLGSADGTASTAALHLALHGDPEGRDAAVTWLNQYGLQENQWRSAQAAFALLEHDDSREGAISFLRHLRDRNMGFGRLNADILDALASHGDERAAEQLVNLAFGSSARDLDAVAGAVRIVSSRNSHGAFQAARRLFVKSGRLEAARILIESNPAEGVTELMQAYVGANLPKRLAIARNLRWAASADLLLPALAGLANSVMEVERRIAAEIAGWLPHGWDIPWLGQLASDPVQAVEEAAIESVLRRTAGAAAVELIEVIPMLPKPRQWSYMRALIDMADPHLLMHEGDPLDIRRVVRSLPEEFAIEAQRLLDRRRQEVERKEKDAARKEE